MRRSTSLFSAALLGLAAVSGGGRALADPPRPQVLVHNDYNADVLVTLTDLNTVNGDLVVQDQPLDAGGDWRVKASLDSFGVYRLHWKVQDAGRTKSEEGDCQGAPEFPCPVDLFLAHTP